MKSDEILANKLVKYCNMKDFCPDTRPSKCPKELLLVHPSISACIPCVIDWARKQADEKAMAFSEEDKWVLEKLIVLSKPCLDDSERITLEALRKKVQGE